MEKGGMKEKGHRKNKDNVDEREVEGLGRAGKGRR